MTHTPNRRNLNNNILGIAQSQTMNLAGSPRPHVCSFAQSCAPRIPDGGCVFAPDIQPFALHAASNGGWRRQKYQLHRGH